MVQKIIIEAKKILIHLIFLKVPTKQRYLHWKQAKNTVVETESSPLLESFCNIKSIVLDLEMLNFKLQVMMTKLSWWAQ